VLKKGFILKKFPDAFKHGNHQKDEIWIMERDVEDISIILNGTIPKYRIHEIKDDKALVSKIRLLNVYEEEMLTPDDMYLGTGCASGRHMVMERKTEWVLLCDLNLAIDKLL